MPLLLANQVFLHAVNIYGVGLRKGEGWNMAA